MNDLAAISLATRTLNQVSGRTPLKDVLSLMSRQGVDVVAVERAGELLGLCTEAVLSDINLADPEVLLSPVSQLKLEAAHTLPAEASVREVCRLLHRHACHFALFRSVGRQDYRLLTDMDVIRHVGLEAFIAEQEVTIRQLDEPLIMDAGASATEVSEKLYAHHVSSVLIRCEGDDPAILTRRDLIRWLTHDPEAPAGRMASRPVRALKLGATLGDAQAVMQAEGFHHLLFKNESDEIVGILNYGNAFPSFENNALKHIERRLISQEKTELRSRNDLKLARQIIESTLDGVTITDEEARIIAVNPAFTRVTGYSADEVIGKRPNILASGKHNKDFYDAMWRSIRRNGFWQGEIWNKRKNGEIYPEWLTITALRDDDGHISRYVGIFSDITDRKKNEQRIRNFAYFDTLTGLPNRRLLSDRLKQALASARRHRHEVAMLFLDLDKFKAINDTYGHDVGDEVLKEMARRLSANVREGDTIARLAGDEFVIMVPEVESDVELEKLASRIVACFEAPFEHNELTLPLSTSIGIAVWPREAKDAEQLMKHADHAMYEAKLSGRNRYVFYHHTQQSSELEKRRVQQFRSLIQSGEMFYSYQPQMDLNTNEVVSIIMKPRWHTESARLDYPELVRLAKRSGHLVPFNLLILRDAFRVARQLAQYRRVRISAPLCGSFVRSAGMIQAVTQMVREQSEARDNIELEIPESALGETETLQKLADLGFHVTVANFAMESGAIGLLRSAPVFAVRLPENVMSHVPEQPRDCQLVSGLVSLLGSMDTRVYLDGVHTERQLRFAQTLDLEGASGYWFGSHATLPEIESQLLLQPV